MIEVNVAILEPDLGNIWHTEEMKIKFSCEWRWLWNVMDEQTRFRMVSLITKTREVRKEGFCQVQGSWKQESEARDY